MSKRSIAAWVAITTLGVLSSSLVVTNAAEKLSANIGRKVANFALKDTRGQAVTLADFKDKRAIVVVFTGTECPINNAFMPRLVELYNSYSTKGVQFLAINSNRQDTPA